MCSLGHLIDWDVKCPSLAMNVREVAKMLKALPGAVYSGTKREAIWLEGLLEKVGESPVLERR